MQGQMSEFTAQLYIYIYIYIFIYIKAYTHSAAEALLVANGPEKSMETWRSLADKGRSTRPENVLQLPLRVLGPSRATKLSELETHIAAWDKEKQYFQQLQPSEVIGPELEKVCLIRMCPAELAKHLAREIKSLQQPEQIRAEISDWIARDDKNRTGGLLANLEDSAINESEGWPEDGEHEGMQDELRQHLGEELFA